MDDDLRFALDVFEILAMRHLSVVIGTAKGKTAFVELTIGIITPAEARQAATSADSFTFHGNKPNLWLFCIEES